MKEKRIEVSFHKVLITESHVPEINYILISGPNLDITNFREIQENIQILRFVEDTFPCIKSSNTVITPEGIVIYRSSML